MKIVRDSIKILKIDANMLVNNYEITNNRKYVRMKGSLPFSLLTIELQMQGEKFKYEKLANSFTTYSIINVDFMCDYKEITEENKDKYTYFVEGNKVIPKVGESVKVMCSQELREYIYQNGFNIIHNGKVVHYVSLVRSSSNAKSGSKLFIREDLQKPILYDFIRMGITFDEDELLDLPAWLTYESLLLSSIDDTININLDNICVVDDVKINYQDTVSVTKFENGKLVQKDELYNIENTPADGLCLINKNLTEWCYLLLRNSFFKGAAISTDFELAKKDLGKEYYVDMWGRKFECPDLIITPSTLKLFKFSYKFSSTLEMFEYWKKHCCKVFGIVKHNKHSGKHEGRYGQLSYQVLNSLYTASYDDVYSIMKNELEYLHNLKTDESYFKLYSNLNKATFSDDFISTMTSLNNDFLKTDLYKKYKSNVINEYIKYLKKSKIKVKGLDYFTIFGLPNVILREALELKWDPDSVVGNICYCSTYSLGKQLFSFRNPHVSPGNVVVLKNAYWDDLKYFDKLNQGNVCILNTGRSSLMDAFSGCDNDGDTIALCPDETLIRLAKEIESEGLFKAPVNSIPSKKLLKTLSAKDMAKVDDDISKNCIGEIVNLSAVILSYIGSIHNQNKNDERLKGLADLCNMMSVASGIEIDKSKKDSDVSSQEIIDFVKKELSYLFEKETILVNKHRLSEEEYQKFMKTKDKAILKKEKEALVRPIFLKYAQSKYSINYSFRLFNCPSDFVCDILDKFNIRNGRTKTIPMSDLIIKNKTYEHANRNQIKTIIDKLKYYKSDYCNIQYSKEYDALDKIIEKEKIYNNLEESFKIMNIKQDTIYCLLLRILNKEESEKMIKASKNRELTEQNIIFLRKNRNLLLEILFKTHKEEFISCFKNFKQETEFLLEDENFGNIEIWGKKYKRVKF